MTETQVIDQVTDLPTTPLKKRDLVAQDGLDTLQKSGRIKPGTMRSLAPNDLSELMSFATAMATGNCGVPEHLRGNPGACLRVCVDWQQTGLSPFFLADHSYLVESKKGGEKFAYDSMVIHAIVERHAALEGRLRFAFEGKVEDGTLTCTVTGRMIGEPAPFVWTSPMLKDIKVKNSPEWVNNPKKQIFYHTSRDWARVYCPDVLGGVYSPDELDAEYGASRARDVTPSLGDRLYAQGADRGGFDAQGIATTLRDPHAEEREATHEPAAEAGENATAEGNASQEASEGGPKTEGEYVAYADAWMDKIADREDAFARWDGEREMRTACKVKITKRQKLETKLFNKFGPKL